jgi:hypothetical protein
MEQSHVMNLNLNQVLAIVLVVLGVFVASTAQLTDLFGAGNAHIIVSLSGLLMSILSGILGVLTGQAGQIKAVRSMPGVDQVVVNANANATLAGLAVDRGEPKIKIAPGAEAAVKATAAS